MDFLRDGWREPDDGIWEVRGPRRHFTHSKVMAWVAIDRAIKTAEEYGREGPIDVWKKVRQEIHDQVCDEGFNVSRGSFTQYYGSDQLDASLLMIPLVGFLPAHDPRVRGTIEAIENELVDGGFVLRYRTVDTGDVDGLSGREGAFLACSFWLADCLSLLGREHDARQLLDRLLGLRNDLGLLAEEYDPVAGRLVGNFPQAFSHVSLVNSASKLMGQEKPSSDHVILGLARRSLTRGRGLPVPRHLSGVTAQSMVTKLMENAGTTTGAGAAGLLQSAVATPESRDDAGSGPVTPAKRRGKPTTKPSARRSRPLATKAPIKAEKASAKKAPATKAPAKGAKAIGATTTTRGAATRGTATLVAGGQGPTQTKKAQTKKAPAKKAQTKKAQTKKAQTKKAPAKRAPAKRARSAVQDR
jgi:hypothetical protein